MNTRPQQRAAFFLCNYSIGKSSPVVCIIDFLTDYFSVDVYLHRVGHLNAKVLQKVNAITELPATIDDITSINSIQSFIYDQYIACDANGFALCKTLFPKSRPFYYSLELYFRNNYFNLNYPEKVCTVERNTINTIQGLIIQSPEREQLFRDEYQLAPDIPTFFLPVTYMQPSCKEKSRYLHDKFGIHDDKKIALHLGGIQEQHCLIELADAFKGIPNWILILHGNAYGDYKAKLKRFIRHHKITNVILSDDFMEHIEDMDIVLQSADIGVAWYKSVSPNLTTAGKSSGKISAYLRFGMPVITNAYPSSIEAIADRGCGICIETLNEICHALKTIETDYHQYANNAYIEYDRVYWFENYRQLLYKFIDSSQASDPFLSPAMTPDNIDRYWIRKSILDALTSYICLCRGVLLDIGCGQMPYKSLVLSNTNIRQYIGIDIENPIYQKQSAPDYFWNGTEIPLADNSIDCAIATELFEHLPNIEVVLHEAIRVLKPGGSLFFTVPFLWPLHDMPNDEYRYTPTSLVRHFKQTGFVNIDIKALGGWNASLAQMIGLWLRRSYMSPEEREHFTEMMFPLYQMLIERENTRRVLTYEDMLKGNVMITGLYGTVTKPIDRKFQISASLSSCTSEETGTFIKTNNNHIKIGYILLGIPVASETFILNEIIGLQDLGHEVFPVAIFNSQKCQEQLVDQLQHPILDLTRLRNLQNITQNEFTDAALQVIHSLNLPLWYAPYVAAVAEYVKQQQIQHLHAHFVTEAAIITSLVSRIINIPFTVTAHAYDLFVTGESKPCGLSLHERLSIILPQASALLTISEFNRRFINKASNYQYSDKIYVVRCGVNPSMFSLKDRPLRQKVIFLSVGRMVEKKGHAYLLMAFKLALSLNTQLELRIIGDGLLKEELQALCTQLQLDTNVTFLGAVPSHVVDEEMTRADVFVLHSVTAKNGDMEGIPVSLMEASLSGLPVLATEHSGTAELVVNGETGFLVKEKDVEALAQQMLELASSDELRKKLGRTGSEVVAKKFNLSTEVQKLSDIFQAGLQSQIVTKPTHVHKSSDINTVQCPICGNQAPEFLPFGVRPRPNAQCPACGSLERHRLLWLFLHQKTNLFTIPRLKVLDVAPSPCLSERIKNIPGIMYLSIDLHSPHAMRKMDLTNLLLPDNYFDCIICCHVLEHIPDDKKAMQELLRVLKPGGWAILQVPLRSGYTQEGTHITDPAERTRLFGQHDHVRYYGTDDYKERLESQGFTVDVIPFAKSLPTADMQRYAMHSGDIYFCKKEAGKGFMG